MNDTGKGGRGDASMEKGDDSKPPSKMAAPPPLVQAPAPKTKDGDGDVRDKIPSKRESVTERGLEVAQKADETGKTSVMDLKAPVRPQSLIRLYITTFDPSWAPQYVPCNSKVLKTSKSRSFT